MFVSLHFYFVYTEWFIWLFDFLDFFVLCVNPNLDVQNLYIYTAIICNIAYMSIKSWWWKIFEVKNWSVLEVNSLICTSSSMVSILYRWNGYHASMNSKGPCSLPLQLQQKWPQVTQYTFMLLSSEPGFGLGREMSHSLTHYTFRYGSG